MLGQSIYVPDNPAYTGGSPQAVHERLWAEGRRRRLRIRGAMAAAGLVAGTWLVAVWFGLLAAALIAAADTARYWRMRAASSVWRKGQRGEKRTALVLRYALEWHGHHLIVQGREIPGHGLLDHLVISDTGVVLIDNRAVAPETQIAAFKGSLFIDDRPAAATAAALRDKARAVAAFLERRSGVPVDVAVVSVVHGGVLRGGPIAAEGITLLRVRHLPRWIKDRDVVYRPEQVAAIADAVRTLPISRQAAVVG